MKFYGIADAHGIESFRPVEFNFETDGLQIDPRELSIMILRANANRQRHAVVYQVELAVDDAKIVDDLIDAGEYQEALIEIKNRAKSVALAKNITGAEKSWKMIPNPDLDPFS
jgi:hypothetical protein